MVFRFSESIGCQSNLSICRICPKKIYLSFNDGLLNLFYVQKIDIHQNGGKLKRNYFDTTIYYLLLQVQRYFNNRK